MLTRRGAPARAAPRRRRARGGSLRLRLPSVDLVVLDEQLPLLAPELLQGALKVVQRLGVLVEFHYVDRHRVAVLGVQEHLALLLPSLRSLSLLLPQAAGHAYGSGQRGYGNAAVGALVHGGDGLHQPIHGALALHEDAQPHQPVQEVLGLQHAGSPAVLGAEERREAPAEARLDVVDAEDYPRGQLLLHGHVFVRQPQPVEPLLRAGLGQGALGL
mmetsp:Transcript_25471/g.73073  ORF Transcript_25471/g.73073 Transcript_25471/m.73073 type:complete len:216 (+) Transcript_25471:63-710(+)